jgi:hypothetical protein
MAVTIEKHDGRARLIECMTDLLRLLPTYNRAAIEQNNNGGALPLWSSELIQTLDQRH